MKLLPTFALLLSSVLLQTSNATPTSLTPEQIKDLQSLDPNEAQILAKALQEQLLKRNSKSPLAKRSNPSGSYAPAKVPCPQQPDTIGPGFIRNATNQAVNPQEAQYIDSHRQNKQADWTSFLKNSGISDSDIPGGFDNYTSDVSRLPKVGLALSGGGYRAMLYGSGVLQGLDGRNETANKAKVGGVLQMADYVAGLSGGSWAVGTLALNDHRTVQDLLANVWDLSSNLVIPKDDKVSIYADWVADVAKKRLAGWQTSLSDYWGRALSYHLVDNKVYPNHGEATDFSDIRNTSSYKNQSYPFPIVMADEREPGELLISSNTSIFEFTPLEFGSWTPKLEAFIPIELLGSTFNDGQPNGTCINGYENFGFVVATSATLFNALYNMLIQSDGDSLIENALEALLGSVSQDLNDVSQVPNSFYGYRNDTSLIYDRAMITMVDGGEDGENVPLWPLLQPARNLDFILAIDSSADVTDWPNGTSLVETYLRSQASEFSKIPVPKVPSQNTFVNRGLNTRPTFFGCGGNSSDVQNADTAANNTIAPILAYLPNYPYSGLGNTSTYQLAYSNSEAQLVIDNAVQVATLGGGNTDWSTCLSCAMLERSFTRSNTPRPSACSACLNKYCWDGQTNDTTPSNPYSPPVGLPEFVTSNGELQRAPVYTGGNGSSAGASSSRADSEDGNAANVNIGSALAASIVGAVVGLSLLA